MPFGLSRQAVGQGTAEGEVLLISCNQHSAELKACDLGAAEATACDWEADTKLAFAIVIENGGATATQPMSRGSLAFPRCRNARRG